MREETFLPHHYKYNRIGLSTTRHGRYNRHIFLPYLYQVRRENFCVYHSWQEVFRLPVLPVPLDTTLLYEVVTPKPNNEIILPNFHSLG